MLLMMMIGWFVVVYVSSLVVWMMVVVVVVVPIGYCTFDDCLYSRMGMIERRNGVVMMLRVGSREGMVLLLMFQTL